MHGTKRDTPERTGSYTRMTIFNRKIITTFGRHIAVSLPLPFSLSRAHTLIIQEEKYSHLRLGIKAPFHSGAFFKTLNYSFLEEGRDEAQAFSALTGCFHVWPATSQTGPAS